MKLLCQKIKSHMCLEIFQSTNETNRRGQGVLFQRFLACEQALPLGDIVKSRRTRGTREETRKRETGSGTSRLRRSLSRLASLARIGERKLIENGTPTVPMVPLLRIHNWQVSSATLGHCYSQYHR